MAKQIINIGTTANDHTGTSLRAGGDMINDNFTEVYSGGNDSLKIRMIDCVNTEPLGQAVFTNLIGKTPAQVGEGAMYCFRWTHQGAFWIRLVVSDGTYWHDLNSNPVTP